MHSIYEKYSLYDGRLLTLSFDILLDMFLKFSGFSADMSLSDMCHCFGISIVFSSTLFPRNKGLPARVLTWNKVLVRTIEPPQVVV